jgi:hypothetical protein
MAQPCLDLRADAELVDHLAEVDARRRARGVRRVDRARGEQRRAQRALVRHIGKIASLAHRDGGGHRAQVGARSGNDLGVRGEIRDLRIGEDHDVARLAGPELVEHRAHGAEAALDVDAGFARRRLHQSLRSAGADEARHWSDFAPEIFTTRAHFSMSSRMKWPNSSGVIDIETALGRPRPSSCRRRCGRDSAFNRSTIAFGAAGGAEPSQITAS